MKGAIKVALKWIFYASISVVLLTNANANAIAMTEQRLAALQLEDDIRNTHYFNNIAIRNVELHHNGLDHRIVVYKVTMKENSTQQLDNKILPKIPELGEILWTITGNQLLISEDDCLEFDARHCDVYNQTTPKGWPVCSSLCLNGGPEYLAFDEKAGKIYISAHIGIGGTGGGPFAVYSANVNTKEIKKLAIAFYPSVSSLSPGGHYLIFAGGDLQVLDTETGEIFDAGEHRINKNNQGFSIAADVKWINDYTLQYQTLEYKEKFSKNADIEVTKILDIRSRTTKIVN